MSTAEPKSDPLRLTRCMRCGYSLENLPDEGTCPECGLEYDQSIVVFYGEGRDTNAFFDPTGSRVAVLLCLGYAAMEAHLGWNQFRRGQWLGLVQAGGPIVLLGTMLMWRLLARRAGGGNLLQCRFNSFGCLQCPLPEQTTGLADPHRIISAFWLLLLGACLLGGVTQLSKPWSLVALSLGIIIAPFAWRWHSRKRAMEAQVPEVAAMAALAVAAGNGPRATPKAWVGVRGISIQPVKSRPGRYRFIFGKAIDAEVDCTGEQAAALWNRVCDWRAAAGVPIQEGVAIQDEWKGGRGFPVLPPRGMEE
jgi:hypothetical protein